ncbi:MAG: hypothetical protein QM778_28920 [Myxococcales bacterium]
MAYERMSSTELHQALRDSSNRALCAEDASLRLLFELQVHQIELEMQNREMREMRAELEASRDRYASRYDFSPVVLCTLDDRGVIVDLNLTAAEFFGREREFLRRLPITVFLKDDTLRLWQLMGEAATTGRRVRGTFKLLLAGKSLSAEFLCVPAERGHGSKKNRVFEVAIVETKVVQEAVEVSSG